MKNLHYLKKFVVMVLAAMMTLSTFAMPTFAAENKVATITGVEDGATVVAYQFVEQNPKTYKWKPLAWVGGTQLTDNTGFKFTHGNQEYTYYYESTDYGSGAKDNKPALEALAQKARTTTPVAAAADESKNIAVNFAQNANKDYTGTLPNLGSYVVIVDSNNTDTDSVTVYSPMVVSLAYAKDNMGTPDDPSDDKYTMQAGSFTVAQAKKSNAGFDKVIKTKPDNGENECLDDASEANNKGDTLKPGDVTTFEVTATAPAYSEDFFITQGSYKGPTVKITDELLKLTLVKDDKDDEVGYKKSFVVKFNGKTLEASKYTLTPAANGKSFELVVTDKATLKAGGTYVINYDAVLDADAFTGFDANTNTAKYTYTRKPGVDTNGKKFDNEEEEITFHYTFDIDGNINGQDEGREIIKVGIDNYTGDLVTSEKNFTSAQKPLADAEFVLVKKGTDEVVCAAISASDGRLKEKKDNNKNYVNVSYKGKDYPAKGLTKIDAGEYELIETFAPDPYKANGTAIPVVITAELYDDTVMQTKDDGTVVQLHRKGMLKSYSVKVNNEDTNTYTWANNGKDEFSTIYKYTDKDGKVVETTDLATFLSGATNIVNTNIGTLPSTGGMGTVLFTVGGAAIMALAIFLLFGGKKKQHQK